MEKESSKLKAEIQIIEWVDQRQELQKEKDHIIKAYQESTDEIVKQAYEQLYDDIVAGIKHISRRIVLLRDAIRGD